MHRGGGRHAPPLLHARCLHRPRARAAILSPWCSIPRRSPIPRCSRSRGSSTCPRQCSSCRRTTRTSARGCASSRPGRELPFAGHPTVGTAVLLGLHGPWQGPWRLRLRAGGDRRPRRLRGRGERRGQGLGDLHPAAAARGGRARGFPQGGSRAQRSGLADAISACPATPQRVFGGRAFTFVPVASRDAIAQARPQPAAWRERSSPPATPTPSSTRKR